MGPQHVRCGMLFWGAICASLYLPSMGPQHVRCGMHRAASGIADSTALQWGRNMFVAECGPLYTARAAAARSFNGAATCSLRNDRALPRRGKADVPSMGPQHVRCGMPHGLVAACDLVHSFNGAATCSLRNAWQPIRRHRLRRNPFNGAATCSLRNAQTWGQRGRPAAPFNGAATCSLRNVLQYSQPTQRWLILQWGRNMFVAECIQQFRERADILHLQWGRNMFVAECR